MHVKACGLPGTTIIMSVHVCNAFPAGCRTQIAPVSAWAIASKLRAMAGHHGHDGV
jgi:hypothetical protein